MDFKHVQMIGHRLGWTWP